MARIRKQAALLRSMGPGRVLDGLVGSMCEVDTDERVIHVTFDDGPDPEVTPGVLDALEEFEAPATFFVLANAAHNHPDVLHEIVARGHEVGLHGRTHVLLSKAPWETIDDEILRSHEELEELLGKEVTHFRPAYGTHSPKSLAACRSRRLTTVLWSVDTEDWKGLPKDQPLQGTTHRIAPGGIVLLHDTPFENSVEGERARGMVGKDDLTRALLARLNEQDLRPVTLDELIASGRPVRRANVVR